MALQNLISASLPQEDQDAIMTSLTSIETKLAFLVDLTDDQRKSLHYLKEKNHGFVLSTLELAKKNPGFLPREFDVPEFQKDTDLFDKLFTIKQALSGLLRRIEDTTSLAGSEAYSAALAVYNYAIAGNVGTQGIEPYVDEMARRFARKSKTVPPAAKTKP